MVCLSLQGTYISVQISVYLSLTCLYIPYTYRNSWADLNQEFNKIVNIFQSQVNELNNWFLSEFTPLWVDEFQVRSVNWKINLNASLLSLCSIKKDQKRKNVYHVYQ